jgi:NADP-dependent 3-hydroxy acid dehydrogenase YdfG
MGTGQFAGQVVWITGAGSGIGRAVAHRFATGGARLALLGRRREALAEVHKEIAATNAEVALEPLDVSNRAAVDTAAQRLLERWGRVDILVNNAGINLPRRSFRELSAESWDEMIAINLTGAYNLIRAVLPSMRAAKAGLIVNVASNAGKFASLLAGPSYTAAKHGMVGLSHSINEEEWKNGIRACALCPGEVNTPILAKRKLRPPEADIAKMMTPEDVAAAVMFVASLPPRTIVTELTMLPVNRRQPQAGEF